MYYYEKHRPSTGRRLTILLVILASLGVGIFGGKYSAFDLLALKKMQALQVVELEAILEETRLLKLEEEAILTDDLALEKLARERYGLIRDGEKLIRFVSTSN